MVHQAVDARTDNHQPGQDPTGPREAVSILIPTSSGVEMQAILGGVLSKARCAELGAWVAHREDLRLAACSGPHLPALRIGQPDRNRCS